MSELPDNSIQCVVTSPPYWGLRKYSGNQGLIWGDDTNCQHQWGNELPSSKGHKAGETNPGKEGYTKDKGAWPSTSGQFCSLCGAWKGQLGLEPSPDCGGHYLKLKDGLTPKQKEYVLSELRKLGAI